MTEDSIVAAALRKKDPVERAAFLDLVCAGEDATRARVDARIRQELGPEEAQTLNVSEGAYTSSDTNADGSTAATSKEGPGSLIGPYKLIQPIGAGGMGVVYLAEQQYPVRRQVALKIIKQGMDTEQVIARFEAERQALALMDHPNIAKVLDAGTTDSGRPYFVMELVNGVPINRYCDTQRLTIRERLELFLPICQAIQHAHQKGIIHRDIKPSNVLVAVYDGKPVPKVIDFGIAKATGQHLTEATMFTQLGAIVGTLEYMSPEQAEPTALDIDTRSDIYSLGALLYELLTGSTPLASVDMRHAAYLEMLRKIREDEPPTPSSRLSQSTETLLATSSQRKTDPGRLPKMLEGELDWIVMKALEKDRTRRYETANGFARDVERYLSGDPVEAGAPSATYRLRKFANKNRVLISTVLAFAALLVLGVVVSTWQAVRARRAEHAAKVERDRADKEADISKAITDFLQNSLLSQASTQQQSGVNEAPDPDVKVRTLLDRAAATIGEKFKDQPLVESGVRSTIGVTYRDLNLMPQAEEQFQKAYDLSVRYRGGDDPETLIALQNLSLVKSDQGKYREALQIKEKVVEAMTRVLGAHDKRTLSSMQSLGVSYLYLGDYAKAEPLFKQVYDEQERTLGIDDARTLNTSDSLAKLYTEQRRYQQAEPLLTMGLESCRRVYGKGHPYTLREMYGLAVVYKGEEKYALAEPLFFEVLDGNTKLLGADHPNTIAVMNQIASLYGKEGKPAEALAMSEKVYESSRRVQGPDHPNTMAMEGGLAMGYEGAGQTAKAERTLKDAIDRQKRVLGPGHPGTLTALSNLAYLYEQHGRFAEAVPLQIQIQQNASKSLGTNERSVIVATATLGRDYLMLHQYEKAEKELRDVHEKEVKSEPDHWVRFHTESMLGGALLGQKKYAAAEPLILSGYAGLKEREPKMPKGGKVYIPEAGERVLQLYKSWGKPGKVAEWREKLKIEAPGSAAKP